MAWLGHLDHDTAVDRLHGDFSGFAGMMATTRPSVRPEGDGELVDGYILGSDIGSGSCKTLISTVDGNVVARSAASYSPHYPQPGWVEYRPDDWYDAFCQSARDALAASSVDPAQILSVAIVGITHDAVLLGSRGQVLRPAIHFNDQRCLEELQSLVDIWGDEILSRTCNSASTLWTWPQLEWIRKHRPQTWSEVRHILFPKDYVRTRLTGEAPTFTDTIDAAGTLLFDPRAQEWIAPFTEALGVPGNWLPNARHPLEGAGTVSRSGSADSGLAIGTPVVVGTTDTAAELLAAGAVVPGRLVLKLASVGRIAFTATSPLLHRHVLNYPHILDGVWYPGTATKYAAHAFQWLREALWKGVDENGYERMDLAAAEIEPGSDGLIFLPHLMGESAPLWNPILTASFVGVGLHHHLGHFTRSVLEGVAFAMRDAWEAVRDLGLDGDRVALVGNGASSPLWSQIIADVFGRPIFVPTERDAAFGAVLLGAIALGALDAQPAALESVVHREALRRPSPSNTDLYDELFAIYRKADKSTGAVAGLLYDFRRNRGAATGKGGTSYA